MYLDASGGVYLVHGVARRAAGLAVQVVGLHEHGVVGQAAQPHVALAAQVQLHALADVESATHSHS